MDTLADILAIQYVGNFADDKANFDRVDTFLRRPNIPAAEKYMADYHANLKGMGQRLENPGEPLNVTTQEYYDNYAKHHPWVGYVK